MIKIRKYKISDIYSLEKLGKENLPIYYKMSDFIFNLISNKRRAEGLIHQYRHRLTSPDLR